MMMAVVAVDILEVVSSPCSNLEMDPWGRMSRDRVRIGSLFYPNYRPPSDCSA